MFVTRKYYHDVQKRDQFTKISSSCPRYFMSIVMRKLAFCICENKDADQVTAKLISAFVSAIKLVQFLYFLNTKFQAPSHLLWLHSLVCVVPFAISWALAHCHFIRVTPPCDLYPLANHFFIVKLGFTWVYIVFLFLLKNIERGYSEAVLTYTPTMF